jgi:hypothetical protein
MILARYMTYSQSHPTWSLNWIMLWYVTLYKHKKIGYSLSCLTSRRVEDGQSMIFNLNHETLMESMVDHGIIIRVSSMYSRWKCRWCILQDFILRLQFSSVSNYYIVCSGLVGYIFLKFNSWILLEEVPPNHVIEDVWHFIDMKYLIYVRSLTST